MKLYGSLTSPYVRKLRVLLHEKGIAYTFVEDNPHAAASRVPLLNPLGKVPVLELDNHEVLFESTLMVEYIDGLKGKALMPAEGAARLQALRWHALGQGIMDAVITRMLETRRPAGKIMAEVVVRQEEKIARALKYAESVERGEVYLLEDRLTLADIALGVALEYIDFRYPHDWRGEHPRLASWLTGIGTRPSFTETRPPNP